MKKVISVFTLVVLLLIVSTAAVAAETTDLERNQNYILGIVTEGKDVNNDGLINVVDSCLIKRELIKPEETTTSEDITTETLPPIEEITTTESEETIEPATTEAEITTTESEETIESATTEAEITTTEAEETIENDGLERIQFICEKGLYNFVQEVTIPDEELPNTTLERLVIEYIGIPENKEIPNPNYPHQWQSEKFEYEGKTYNYIINPYVLTKRNLGLLQMLVNGELGLNAFYIQKFDFDRNLKVDEKDLEIQFKCCHANPQNFLYNERGWPCGELYVGLEQLRKQGKLIKNRKIYISEERQVEAIENAYLAPSMTYITELGYEFEPDYFYKCISDEGETVKIQYAEQVIEIPKSEIIWWLTF